MSQPPTTLERAFQLARSGEFSTIEALRRQLRLEGFKDQNWQVTGPALISQLKKLCASARRDAPLEQTPSPDAPAPPPESAGP